MLPGCSGSYVDVGVCRLQISFYSCVVLFRFALLQVEYAIEAIKLGSTAVGIQTKEGVILAVEKRLTSPLLEPSSVEKVTTLSMMVMMIGGCIVADLRGEALLLLSAMLPGVFRFVRQC